MSDLHAALRRCLTDFMFFADRFLYIIPMKGGKKQKLTFTKPQRVLHALVEQIQETRPVRIVALKARRMGFSTYFSARYYWKVTWGREKCAMQITHEPAASETLFRMIKRFYEGIPRELRPEIRANNARMMDFNNKDGTGLDSTFRVATAGKDDIGSGQLVHFIHFSEVAKYPPGNTQGLMSSVLQCVPDPDVAPDAEIVLESTANGLGGEFYDRFWGARYRLIVRKLDEDGDPLVEEVLNESALKDNDYTAIFLPWFLMEIYQKDPPADPEERVLTEEEERIKEEFGLSDRQIYWRRYTIASKCNGDIDFFNQDYPARPEDAFIGGGKPVFDNAAVFRLKQAAPDPIQRYSCLTSIGTWKKDDAGELRVWEEPNMMRAYIVAADVAEAASSTSDLSSADVIDHATGKQVAQWHGRVLPKEFARILDSLGKRYNNALMVVESAGGGNTVLAYLQDHAYPRIYWRERRDPPFKPERKIGFSTNNATRPMLLDNLILEMTEGSHGIQCAETFDEMLSFRYQDDGKPQADAGRHDDRVMSIAIAKFVRTRVQMPHSHNRREDAPGMQRRMRSSKGWT